MVKDLWLGPSRHGLFEPRAGLDSSDIATASNARLAPSHWHPTEASMLHVKSLTAVTEHSRLALACDTFLRPYVV